MESVNNVMKRYKGLTYYSSQERHPRGGVWGVLPCVSHIGMCCTKGQGFLRRFGLKISCEQSLLRSS